MTAHTSSDDAKSPARPRSAAVDSADRTVADVIHDHPASLDAMRRLGVNHCCGAGLTLKQAAAAAGVALDVLLRALPPAVGVARLDVRGLEPPQPMIRILDALDR